MTTFEYYKRRVSDWWYDTKNGIKALWYWIPKIWNDRNYSNDDIWQIIYYKVKRKRQYFENRQYMRYVGIERDIERMKRLEYVLSKRHLKPFEYERLSGIEKHRERWGESDWHFEPCEDRPEYSTLEITRPNVNSEQDEKDERRQRRQIYERAEMLRKQDEEYVLNMIRKYWESWWI